MLLLLQIFADDVLPILAIASVGFVMVRRGSVSASALSRVTLNALVPCLVFASLIASNVGADEFVLVVLLTCAVIGFRGALGILGARLLRLDQPMTRGLVIVTMFSNCGNFGLSVTALAFGAAALARATIIFVTGSVLTYTLGAVIVATGDRSPRALAGQVLRVPMLYAALAAIAVLASGITVPATVMRPVGLLGNAALPCMMLIMGIQLGQTTRLENVRPIAVATATTLVIAPTFAFLLSHAIGLDPSAQQAVVLQAAMPGAVATTILAVEYDTVPAFVTTAVFVATVLSPFTITPLIAFLR
jgi:malate permease and related proteins